MMRSLVRTLGIALCALGVPAAAAIAQCPDGTPPPCSGSTPPAAPRRAAPQLDERTWIVVPFENVARVQEIDWLKDASVNLLYLDMSKWSDIHVIDDERVADLIREVPEARGGVQLTLQSGLAVARRAGAGRLVMGDLLKLGARTQIVGKVFDVKTGARVRTVRQDALTTDSIMAAFGQLARGVLNVEPPGGTSLGSIGTSSIGAYQAYLSGVGYLNRWILDSARVQFSRAIDLDSTFALAHYKIALVFGWDAPGNPEGLRHAELAQRFSAGLPVRERTLVRGYTLQEKQEYGEACLLFGGLVRSDSSDVEAWYNLGECSYHDPVILALPGDTTTFAFRGSWNTALRAFRQALDLDPTYHLAFQHIQDALLTGVRVGCRPLGRASTCQPQNTPYQAVVVRSGDSLITVPQNSSTSEGATGISLQRVAARRNGTRRQNLLEARRAAEAWLAAGPGEPRPKRAIARILLRLGLVGSADSAYRAAGAGTSSVFEGTGESIDRIEIALKLGQGDRASALVDSMQARPGNGTGNRTLGIIMASIVGRTSQLGPLVASLIPAPDWVRKYYVAQARAVVGAPVDSLFALEATFGRNVSAGGNAARGAAGLLGTLAWIDPSSRRTGWPSALDTSSPDIRVQLMSHLAVGDTVRFRVALAQLDSLAEAGPDQPDNGLSLAGAFGHLVLADTAGALTRLRMFREHSWMHSPIQETLSSGFAFSGMLWPRTLLLLGDLAAATGDRPTAVDAYRMFLEMWKHADPELQPSVARARQALARLGG